MKIREFDENSLVNYYSKNVIDFSWIDKPSQHQFRWRCLDGSEYQNAELETIKHYLKQ